MAAVVLATSVAAAVPAASASFLPITCSINSNLGGASSNFGGTLQVCRNSDSGQARVTGKIFGMSLVGGHVRIKIGAYSKLISVCGVEDKEIDTGWRAGGPVLQISDGGCPSTG
ncbi:hypothetical protein AB0C61_07205 [Streptomyces sp. NPDC048680]|uniref:hypothetical protein n=1 Tax=Streptomyces sp. NPDC048680 TaxID=3155492 RepID=UPI003412DA17